MIQQLSSKCFPAKGAAPGDFRVSGAAFIVCALVLAAALFVTLAKLGMFQLMSIAMLPVFVLWFMGMHRILWGGTNAQSRGHGWARAALTAGAGVISS
jgi:hypothetical protein